MAFKKKRASRKKGTPRRTNRIAAAALAASLGAVAVIGPEKEHIEIVQAQPETNIALLTDAAIVATSTANSTATLIRVPTNQFE
jgi:hypothetical protein